MAVGSGHLLLGIPLLALTGFHDLLDGPVAKAAGTASVRGAFFDSVADRVADAVLMGGVAWYLVSVHEGELALLPLAVLGVTSIVSYERAKAEALGLSAAKGGLMERAERMILLGVGFLASWLLVPVLWVLLGLVTATAVGRFVRVWRVAEGPPRPQPGVRASMAPDAAPLRWRPGRVESRWRRGVRGRRTPTGQRPRRRAARTVAGPPPGGAGQPDPPGTPVGPTGGRAAAHRGHPRPRVLGSQPGLTGPGRPHRRRGSQAGPADVRHLPCPGAPC